MARGISALVIIAAAVCGCGLLPSGLPPGRCLSDADCGAGMTCDLQSDLCVASADGGAGDGAGDGSRDGVATDGGKCSTNSACHDPTKPLCGAAGVCVGCGAVGAPSWCAAADPAHPICGSTGACVECIASSQCTKDATKPLCGSTGTCVGCSDAAAPTCASADPAHPVCGTAGACVECTASLQCTAVATKPYCDPAAKKCVPCSADAQCAGKAGPGVCRSSDGHCAIDAETVYVAAPAGSCSLAPDGSATQPFCTLHDGVAAANSNRNLLVVRGAVNGLEAAVGASASPLSIVGQQQATIAPGTSPGLRVTGATVAIRDVTIASGLDVGLIAELGATLRLDGVTFTGNGKGGLRVTGSGFDVVNSLFVGNGGVRDTTVGFFGGAYLGMPTAGQPHRFDFNTIVQNKQVGVICEDATQSLMAVLMSGNVAADTNCLVTSSKTTVDGDPMVSVTYRLTATSSCRNAVGAAPGGAPDHDIDGTARPQDGKYDCGASEFKP